LICSVRHRGLVGLFFILIYRAIPNSATARPPTGRGSAAPCAGWGRVEADGQRQRRGARRRNGAVRRQRPALGERGYSGSGQQTDGSTVIDRRYRGGGGMATEMLRQAQDDKPRGGIGWDSRRYTGNGLRSAPAATAEGRGPRTGSRLQSGYNRRVMAFADCGNPPLTPPRRGRRRYRTMRRQLSKIDIFTGRGVAGRV
jgi:hypothetical protein